MSAIFFTLSLLCGIALAAASVKLFLATKKGVPFGGITLASPQPAMIGIVIGVVVLLSSLIVFFPLSSEVSDLGDQLDRAQGSLGSTQKHLETAGDDIEALKKERDEEKSRLADAQGQIDKLKKDLATKEEASVVKSDKAAGLEQVVESVRQQLAAKTREAEGLASELGIVKASVESARQEFEQLKKVMEKEKEFRRDYTALVEEEEAAPSGTRNKLYFKLLDLRNKYK